MIRFASCFGFVRARSQTIARSNGDLSDRFDIMYGKAYNGYRFGHDKHGYGVQPLVPHQRYVSPAHHHNPSLYWVNTSTNHLVHELLTQANTEVKEGLHELLSAPSDHTTTQMVQEHVPLREVKNDGKNLWGLLLASGYLTAVQARENPDNVNKIVQPCRSVGCFCGC